MTLIIGYETKDGFIIAADSATSRGDTRQISHNRKIRVLNNGLVIAGAGTQAVTDYVVNCIPFPPVEGDELTYLYNMIPMIRDGLKQLGLINGDKTLLEAVQNDDVNFGLIVGINNHVYEVDCYLAVSRLSGITTFGTGSKYALGAIFIQNLSNDNGVTDLGKIKLAFWAANEYDWAVAPPYHAIIKENGKLREVELS